jgi:dynein heavy chain
MVYVDPKDLGYAPYWEKWMNRWKKNKEMIEKFETQIELLQGFFSSYVKMFMDLIYEGIVEGDDTIAQPLSFALPRTNLNLVHQLTRLLDSILPEDEPINDQSPLENIFIFCLVWSFGACLKPEGRRRFEEVLKKNCGQVLPPTSVFDNKFDFETTKSWIPWEKLVIEYRPPDDG